MEVEPQKQKRSAKRILFACEVECGLGLSSPRIIDLSTTGAFIDTITELPEGSRLRLRFKLHEKELALDAQVAHTMRGIGVGVRFLSLTPEQKLAIERLIDEKS